MPELPWVTKRFEPTLAERILSQPGARAALDENYLLWGLPANGAEGRRVARALLSVLAALCLLLVWREKA